MDLNVSPIILLLRKYKFKYDAKKAGEILNLSIQVFQNRSRGYFNGSWENVGFQ